MCLGNKELKAKDFSLVGQIIGVIILIVGLVLKVLNISKIEIHELIMGSFACVIIFSPVYISMWLDKIVLKK